MGDLVPRTSIRPDAVTGPQSWPQPDEDEDDTCDRWCEGCAWCDQSHWRNAYADLHQAHERLVAELRTLAAEYVDSPNRDAREIARHLRSQVSEAMVRKATGVRPRPDRGQG
jgi:hypothetical protein